MSAAASVLVLACAIALFSGVARGEEVVDTTSDVFGSRQGLDALWAPSVPSATPSQGAQEAGDYDPWEKFNERTFSFNHDVLDKYALKPAATAWEKVVPGPVRQSIGNAVYNLATPRRLVNKIAQGRLPGAGQEAGRFLVNSTVGLGGFFDIATPLGIEKTDADTGQTFGVYGISTGPYLVLPFLPPLTVRDAIGYGADSAMDPLSYFIPFFASLGRTAVTTVNERAQNLQLYEQAEEATIDLYGAVRNGYLQRRQKDIEDAIKERDRGNGQVNVAHTGEKQQLPVRKGISGLEEQAGGLALPSAPQPDNSQLFP